MKMRGAKIVVKALEAEGVRFTFGIPGTHNVELYDALEDSKKIEPVLVTDEQSASFMADGVSRTSPSIGVVNVVPGAGLTHALSGIAEAFLANVPMLVLGCGVRTDTGFAYQLHGRPQRHDEPAAAPGQQVDLGRIRPDEHDTDAAPGAIEAREQRHARDHLVADAQGSPAQRCGRDG